MASKSESRSATSTSSVNEDNRVQGSEHSNTLGKGAVLNITNNDELPDNVVDVFKELVTFASGAGELAIESTEKAIASSEKALSQVANVQESAIQGESRIFTDLFPMIALAIVGLIGVSIIKGKS